MAVRITQPLREAFGAQARHFVDVQPIYPDAGIRLEQLMLRLFDPIIPMLESQPDLGRPMTLAPPTSSLEPKSLTAAQWRHALVTLTAPGRPPCRGDH